MNKNIKEQAFFARKAEKVAKDLLGKFICRKFEDGTVLRWCITETEAYDDSESVTYTNKVFQGVGEWCPCNGMLMINCNTEQGSDNVLIRALDCVKGPCKIVDALKIKEIKNEVAGKDVLCSEKLWLEDWGAIVEEYEPNKRVGLVKKPENEEALKEEKNYRARAIRMPFFE